MAGGTRQTNTMEEQLRKLLGSMTELKLAEDADFDFITGLETNILSKLRAPIDSVAQQGLTAAPPEMAQGAGPMPAGGPMPMGGPAGAAAPMPGGGGPQDPNAVADMLIQAMQAQTGGAMPAGPMPSPGATPPGRGPTPSAAINPDELRRVVSQSPR